MVEARRYRRVLIGAGIPPRVVGRALNLRIREVEELYAGKVRLLTLGQADKIERLLSPKARRWVRESRRYPQLLSGAIPVEMVVPIIEGAYADNECQVVAGLVGLPQRSLLRITSDAAGISFPVADMIVLNLLGPDAWLQPPLRAWYWGHGAVIRAAV